MTDEQAWIEPDTWPTIVGNVPIVTVDLIVWTPDGIVLGRRRNEPAKGEWFVPGGRVQKGEGLTDAVTRIGREELSVTVDIVAELGAYEHFFDVADVDDVGGKHHIAHGYVVHTTETDCEIDDQHDELRFFTERPNDLHEYVTAYLDDAGLLLE
jgi:colanic acid biosynthesis protein WcaH